MKTTCGIEPWPMGVRGQTQEETNWSFFIHPKPPHIMTHPNDKAIRRVADEILKVIPEQSRIGSNAMPAT